MSFFGLMLLGFAFARVFGWRRRRWQHRAHVIYWHPMARMDFIAVQPMPTAPEPRAESKFEALKRRYVKGEISDERYERELDELLRTPEGRSSVQ